MDDLSEKLTEFEEAISTMRCEMIEEKGIFSRNQISNMDYINYLKGNLHNLELGNKDINRERARIRGSNLEFYKFHHINDVPWDAWGNLCPTSECKRLNELIRIHVEMQEKEFYNKKNASKNGSIYITGRK